MTTQLACEEKTVELNGLRFHYSDWPSRQPGAPTLLLLHGYTGHARSWDAFAELMTDRYRVIALDQRGHGETGWAAPDQYLNAHMVSDVREFVAALGLEDFALLGLSMGGRVAIHYAGERPEGLAKLVIVDIGPETVASGAARIQAGAQTADVFDSPDEAWAQQRASNPRPPEANHRYRVEHNLMQTDDGKWTWRYDKALRDPSNPRPRPTTEEGWAAVRNINVPTLVLRGELSDILAADIAQHMADEIPDARLIEVKDSGHSIPLDRPDEFAEAVRTFL
ncbi:MAG: alpha/beta fold hydrolase [Chloroflexi bacterium]|nr:alpha/beta fold hydrolase [Chloroflexota bacterium]MDA1147028.1 alpha/beta fold hydrolase [Chloroflexota bacterium]